MRDQCNLDPATLIDASIRFRYRAAVILSDRDLTNGCSGAADGTIESRLYHLKNWRNDLCAVADGYVIVRHYRYSAYGSRTEIDAADYNRDGMTDFFDVLDFIADHGASAARADLNNDGSVTSADSTAFTASFNVASDDSPHAAPRGLYAGYEHDPALDYVGALSGGGAMIYTIESYAHVRHRVYSTELGRWTLRDPIGYVDGMSVYEYCRSQSESTSDPYGLACDFQDLPSLLVGVRPIPPSCAALITKEAWKEAIRHLLIANSACGKLPTVICKPCVKGLCGSTVGDPTVGCTVTLCTNQTIASCGPIDKTLIHEFTHCRQRCESGFEGAAKTWEENMCREVEAYTVEGECKGRPPAAFNRCICARACDSISKLPRQWCIGRCQVLLATGQCRGGHYRP